MPIISEVAISRKFNLGNYETMEVSLQGFLAENEDPKQAMAKLEAEIQAYMHNAHPEVFGAKQQVTASQTAQPQKMVQLTIQEQLEKVKQPFSEFADLLTFTVKEGKIVVTPRQFLGADNFSKVASVVRGLGGQYISAGKESRFELPLQK